MLSENYRVGKKIMNYGQTKNLILAEQLVSLKFKKTECFSLSFYVNSQCLKRLSAEFLNSSEIEGHILQQEVLGRLSLFEFLEGQSCLLRLHCPIFRQRSHRTQNRLRQNLGYFRF